MLAKGRPGHYNLAPGFPLARKFLLGEALCWLKKVLRTVRFSWWVARPSFWCCGRHQKIENHHDPAMRARRALQTGGRIVVWCFQCLKLVTWIVARRQSLSLFGMLNHVFAKCDSDSKIRGTPGHVTCRPRTWHFKGHSEGRKSLLHWAWPSGRLAAQRIGRAQHSMLVSGCFSRDPNNATGLY